MSPSCGYCRYFTIVSPLCLPSKLKPFLMTSPLLYAVMSQTLVSGLQFAQWPDHLSTFCAGFMSSLGSVVKCCCFFLKRTGTDLPLLHSYAPELQLRSPGQQLLVIPRTRQSLLSGRQLNSGTISTTRLERHHRLQHSSRD